MRFWLITFLLLVAHGVLGQSNVKLLSDLYPSRWLRMVSLSDTSIALCLEDSNRFIRLNACGVPVQSMELSDDRLFTVGTTAFAADGQGGMVWVGHRQNLSGGFPLVFLHVSASGSILAMKQYRLPNGNFYPYSVVKAADNQFFVFGNASPVLGNPYRFILKLNQNGEILAQHFGEGGGIWGGARVLQDGGLITRAGAVFYRYDAQLNSLWGFSLPIGGDVYEPPVQVKGGFMVPQFQDGSYGHYLISDDGILLPGRSARIDSVGGWPFHFSDHRGGWFSIIERSFPEGTRPVLIHWDSLGRMQQPLALDLPNDAGNWLVSSGFKHEKKEQIHLAGILQKEGRSQVWTVVVKEGSSMSCWRPVSLKVDTLPDWGLIAVFLPDRPTFSISTTNFPYRFVPKERRLPTLVCGNFLQKSLELGADTTTCGPFSISLKNTKSELFTSYRWSTGSTNPSILVSDTGKYVLQAFEGCEQRWWQDSIRIQNLPLPTQPSDSFLLCRQEEIFLPASPGGWTGTWENGAPALAERQVLKEGNYVLSLEARSCKTTWNFRVDECELAEFPNLISPNDDGRNDDFRPTRIRKHDSGKLEIWNRWGKKIDEVNHFPQKTWSPPKGLSTGLYFWTFSTQLATGQPKQYSGWLQLSSEP
jgi:gliding motility-associated-like protein